MLAATLVAANGNSLAAISKEAPRAYDPMIFGSFLEHFHRQIYGGVFEPGSKLADADGFRTDVIAALKEIKTPIVRWPGGCFVSDYTMADAVFAACYLNAFLRNCDVVSIACFSPAVNTTGLVFTHANGLVKRTTFHVFKLYTGNLLPLVQPCATVSVPLTCGRNTVDALDMVVTTDTSRSRSVLAVVNIACVVWAVVTTVIGAVARW